MIVSKVSFRASGYTEHDRTDLRNTLDQFGAVRLRGIYLPEAGGSGEIWIVLEFIGTTVLTGALAEIGVDIYHRVSNALQGFFARKKARDSFGAEVASITLSFDDLDIIIHNPSDKLVDSLDTIVQKVHRAVSNGALTTKSVTQVDIPGILDTEGWREVRGPIEDRNDNSRYWAISVDHSLIPEFGYDSEEDKLLADLLADNDWFDTEK